MDTSEVTLTLTFRIEVDQSILETLVKDLSNQYLHMIAVELTKAGAAIADTSYGISFVDD
ncbi:hypothetical protein GCM10028819_33340 [Spirosoma humi]